MVLGELCWEPEIPETGKCLKMTSPGPTATEGKTLTKTESDSHRLLLPLPPRCSHLAMKTTGQEVWKDRREVRAAEKGTMGSQIKCAPKFIPVTRAATRARAT